MFPELWELIKAIGRDHVRPMASLNKHEPERCGLLPHSRALVLSNHLMLEPRGPGCEGKNSQVLQGPGVGNCQRILVLSCDLC
jgi:hypothetical protein